MRTDLHVPIWFVVWTSYDGKIDLNYNSYSLSCHSQEEQKAGQGTDLLDWEKGPWGCDTSVLGI